MKYLYLLILTCCTKPYAFPDNTHPGTVTIDFDQQEFRCCADLYLTLRIGNSNIQTDSNYRACGNFSIKEYKSITFNNANTSDVILSVFGCGYDSRAVAKWVVTVKGNGYVTQRHWYSIQNSQLHVTDSIYPSYGRSYVRSMRP